MAKLSHFWKGHIGRFWYFDVSKAPGEKILPFRVGPKWLVGSSLTESLMEWVSKNTLEHPQAALASQNITHINLNTPPDTQKRDTNRQQQTLPDVFKHSKTTLRHSLKMHDRVRLEPILYFGKTVKRKTFFTWLFWDIKISKPPYLPLPKMIEFCHFSYFSCPSERNYNLQSLWITL